MRSIDSSYYYAADDDVTSAAAAAAAAAAAVTSGRNVTIYCGISAPNLTFVTKDGEAAGQLLTLQPGDADGCLMPPTDDFTHDSHSSLQYWALWLLLFPAVTLFGNVLVCVSVFAERALHTVTNYFIVSLAIADIMVAILVMPLAVYVEVNNAEWQLGDALCDAWVAFDVMCCTASILNLAAISIDRFIAVTRPIRYAKQKDSKRMYLLSVGLTWAISIAISLPIAFGMNYTERRRHTPTLCTFYNSDFLIYSSMGSFYIPCVVMLVLYWKMFTTIRELAKRSLLRRGSRFDSVDIQISSSSSAPRKPSSATVNDEPLYRNGRGSCCGRDEYRSNTAMARTTRLDSGVGCDRSAGDDGCQTSLLIRSESPSTAGRRTSSFDACSNEPSPCDRSIDENRSRRSTVDDCYRSLSIDGSCQQLEDDNKTLQSNTVELLPVPGCGGTGRRCLPSILLADAPNVGPSDDDDVIDPTTIPTSGGRTGSEAGLRPPKRDYLKTARLSVTKFNDYMRRLPSARQRKDRNATKRERKATKTLAIVLAVFLFCWVPFFTINIINAVCIRYEVCNDDECSMSVCRIDPLMLSCFVWLGYINSALNPIIYTIFNTEFRHVFNRLLRHPCSCC